MKKELIADIEQQMQKVLDNSQLEKLHHVLMCCLQGYDISVKEDASVDETDYTELFLSSKK